MQTKLISNAAGRERTFALVFDAGEEVIAGITRFATEQDLPGGHFTAIGAFQDVTLGFFDPELANYVRTRFDEQLEVLALVGNIASHRGETKVHAHVVVGRRDATALGGHLLEGRVRPTLEVILSESPADLRRSIDERTGLPLLSFRHSAG